MSTCISRHGEFSSHALSETGAAEERFVCTLCFAIAEPDVYEAVVTTLTWDNPPALINANQRLHHHAKAKLTKAWRVLAEATIRTGWHPVHYRHAHVVVAIRFPTNHRRDVGNYYPTAKAILDGLVDANLLADDSDEHITGPDLRRDRPNGPLRVTVTVKEIA